MSGLGFGRIQFVAISLLAIVVAGCEVKRGQSGPTAASSPAEGAKPENGEAKPAATANDKPSSNAQSNSAASETISAEGSSTVYPICQAFAVEFEKKNKHKVAVGRQGTGGGYKKFAHRQADVWNASRPIDQKDIDERKEKGIEWLELTIAVDGIVIAVNPQNTWCSNLTCAQLKQIWEPDSKVKTWKDLDPSWPADEILLYGADTDSGTFEYFTEVINGKKKASNTRYNPASDDNILVSGIAANKTALGYIPFGYYVENTEKLKILGVSPTKDASETPAPFVTPTEESILSGEYAPLSRPLFMYANLSALQSRPEVVEFIKFAVSEEAQPLIQNRGFVRVKDDVRQAMQKKIETAIGEKSTNKN